MSRIAQRFADLKQAGRKALIPFVTAGDPNPEVTVPLLHAMVAAGADLLELGVPFSDPMAEGPVIQKACERALKHHVGMHDVLAMVKAFREQDKETPIVLMGYMNPVEVMGYDTFAQAAREAGVDGLLTVDMPPEEAGDLVAVLGAADIDPIFLLAPTSVDERIAKICAVASGFIYYVSLKGVTGAANLDVDAVAHKVEQIRKHTDLPIGVGFGIRDADSAARVAQVADAVVVGSAVVNRVAEHAQQPDKINEAVCELLRDMRAAMDD
ncbi:tryptophan synthase subunit alpha [Candidatus Tenderia electrophaga]|jgi:tryptophan synthase alpha chain|uniref:Tryptophan synthase alpha chain n=1 Tax=Candidatus Tenderia electrophaga TaxID=1748243 RepID=A0A0S2TFV8_9GAMM|nr:tryptophan synthase subunit alpha [Candidatus Tenderia electrophaga]